MGLSSPELADALLRLSLFGPIRAETPTGASVLPRGRKAQAILCYLAMCGEAQVPRRRLIELLWSTREVEQGRASLRQSLIEIRHAMAPLLHILKIERTTVALDRGATWIDRLESASRAADAEQRRRAPPVARLMETLTGLDPRFDVWIEDMREQVAALFPQVPPLALSTGTAAVVEDHAVQEGGRRLLLGVAPILQLGAAGMDEFTAPALTQELVTALARFRWLGVRFSPDGGDCDYSVEGYLIPGEADVRVVLRLIDQRDEQIVVWSGETVCPAPLSPQAMAGLTQGVIEQIDPEILAIETRKAVTGSAETQAGYACVLRALALLYRFEDDAWHEASALLTRARALDPNYARAHAISALTRVTGIAQGWSTDPARDLALADMEAARAVGLDPRDSLGLALSGHLHSFVHHEFAAASSLFDRAVAANPSCGFAWGYQALTHAYMRRCAEAWSSLSRAQAIMVHDPFLSFLESFGVVLSFFERDWHGTILRARSQLRIRPRFNNIRKLLIGALCHLDRWNEAAAEHAALVRAEPGFSWKAHLVSYPFHYAEDRELLRRALVRAGLLTDPSLRDEGALCELAPLRSARTMTTLIAKEF